MKRLLFLLIISLCFACRDNRSLLKEPNSEEQLGELLFFDPILSSDSTISCASCHKPELAFSDNSAVSIGVGGKKGTRNTPSAMNQSGRNFMFWDGHTETLEEQAMGPIENPIEMNLPISVVIDRLYRHPQYLSFFNKIYNEKPNRVTIGKAIAAYEHTLETGDTPFDDYMKKGDTTEFRKSEQRGQDIFNVKGKCFDCHFGPDFTTDLFRNIGLFNGKDLNDSGRFIVTRKWDDLGKFKTPGLRNIAMTSPYMHNGMHKTLREVIDYYNEPDKFIKNSINRDTLLNKPLGLTEADKKDLENFLLSLTDRRFKKVGLAP
ncbi:MAG TPA: cytochrome c peroxidase [Bacteroidia bacterium]|jgi:cytochrome c peroxidase|nr:cytochrome c peroxidase [Bacteroidia bacterium]